MSAQEKTISKYKQVDLYLYIPSSWQTLLSILHYKMGFINKPSSARQNVDEAVVIFWM